MPPRPQCVPRQNCSSAARLPSRLTSFCAARQMQSCGLISSRPCLCTSVMVGLHGFRMSLGSKVPIAWWGGGAESSSLSMHSFASAPFAGPDKVFQRSSPARVLDQGKSAWHQFSASSEFHALISQDNPDKICISMYVMDGACFSACKRCFRARHFAAFQPGGECNREGESADRLAWLFDWNLYLRCKSHQIQLSVSWCLDPHMRGDTSKAAHNSVRSLKSNAADLQSKVPEFAMQCVRFTDRDCSPGDLRSFWQLLGIPDALLEIFILVDPCWHNGALHCSSAVSIRPVLRFVVNHACLVFI